MWWHCLHRLGFDRTKTNYFFITCLSQPASWSLNLLASMNTFLSTWNLANGLCAPLWRRLHWYLLSKLQCWVVNLPVFFCSCPELSGGGFVEPCFDSPTTQTMTMTITDKLILEEIDLHQVKTESFTWNWSITSVEGLDSSFLYKYAVIWLLRK